jgi:hypothetical protein
MKRAPRTKFMKLKWLKYLDNLSAKENRMLPAPPNSEMASDTSKYFG